MKTAEPLYKLTPLARQRVAAAVRDGRVHPLQPSWYSLSRLSCYAPQDQPFYAQIAAEGSSARPPLAVSLDSQPGGSLTLRWCSPSGSGVGALTLLRPPAGALFDAWSADAMQASYDDDCALFARLTASVYRSLVARFEECFAVRHESWLVFHRSPIESLEVVGADDFATEPAESDSRSELEAYTGMRLNYLSKAFRSALCLFPLLCKRLEEVNGRALDAGRLRALCEAHDAEQPLEDERVMSPSNTAHLTATLDMLCQLQAKAQPVPRAVR
jgi:hypothetical protein